MLYTPLVLVDALHAAIIVLLFYEDLRALCLIDETVSCF